MCANINVAGLTKERLLAAFNWGTFTDTPNLAADSEWSDS